MTTPTCGKWRLGAWYDPLEIWLKTLERLGEYSRADAVAQRLADALDEFPHHRKNEQFHRFVEFLDATRERCAEKLAEPVE